MTFEQMTLIGEFARHMIYNPVTYAIVLLMFLFLILGGIDE